MVRENLWDSSVRRVRPQNASGKPIDLHSRFIAESSLEEGRTLSVCMLKNTGRPRGRPVFL